jgi:hypothetical protein
LSLAGLPLLLGLLRRLTRIAHIARIARLPLLPRLLRRPHLSPRQRRRIGGTTLSLPWGRGSARFRRHFPLELGRQGIEFLGRPAEGAGVVSQHTFGRPLDAFAELADSRAGALLGPVRLGEIALAQEFGRHFQRLPALPCRLLKMLVQFLGKLTAVQKVLLKLLHPAGVLLLKPSQGVVEFLR